MKNETKNLNWYFQQFRVRVVVDYADTVSAQSLVNVMRTRAEIVIDYKDTMVL